MCSSIQNIFTLYSHFHRLSCTTKERKPMLPVRTTWSLLTLVTRSLDPQPPTISGGDQNLVFASPITPTAPVNPSKQAPLRRTPLNPNRELLHSLVGNSLSRRCGRREKSIIPRVLGGDTGCGWETRMGVDSSQSYENIGTDPTTFSNAILSRPYTNKSKGYS